MIQRSRIPPTLSLPRKGGGYLRSQFSASHRREFRRLPPPCGEGTGAEVSLGTMGEADA